MCDGRSDFVQCDQHFHTFKDLPYYRACIFGDELYFEGEIPKNRPYVGAFYYTPSGLQLFQSKRIASETTRFCTQISKSQENQGNVLTGILGDHFNNPDGDTDIYAFFKYNDSQVFYYKSTLSQNADLDDPQMTWTHLADFSLGATNTSRPVDSVNYLWFHNVLVGMPSMPSQKLNDTPFYQSMPEMVSRYDWRSGTFKV